MQAAKERVLLVDDEPQILTALEDLLGDDYTVFKSESPERALDLVRQDNDIAVVITDQRMPEMNGDEFLRKIGSQNNALRIMVSGYADLPAVLRAINEGKVYAYVTKPWDEDDLRHKVQAAAEHFRLAQELEYERRLLRDLMDNSPDGIYFKDADLRFLRANASFARGLGVANPADLVGRRLSEVLALQAEASASETEDRRVLRERHPILDTVREQRRADRVYFMSETKAPIRSKSGNVIGVVGISRDVTERVKTSEALRESAALLQQQTRILNSILDGMGDGVVVTARDGRTLLLNREASRLLGEAARDVPAHAWAAGIRLVPERRQHPAAHRAEPAVPRHGWRGPGPDGNPGQELGRGGRNRRHYGNSAARPFRCGHGRHFVAPRRHSATEPRATARPVSEDGGDRPAGGRRCARLQQPVDRDRRLLRTGTRGLRGE